MVFKSTTANGAPTGSCASSTPIATLGSCNVYTGAQLSSLTQASFGCGGTAPDRFWCPTSRQTVQHLGTDYLGVWIKANSQTLTNFFGSPLRMQATAVMRVEPKG